MSPSDVAALAAEDAADTSAVPSNAGQAEVAELARQQILLEDQIVETEQIVKNLKRDLRTLSEETLPAALAEHNLAGLPLLDGPVEEIKVEPFYQAHISKAHQDDAFAWLTENDHADLIKAEVKTSFGRDQGEQVEIALEMLQAQGWDVQLKQSVHPSTLKAFVREQMEAGQELPEDLLGVYAGSKTKIVRRKS